MQQRIAAIGQDFDIRNERGQPVYKVDGKVRLVRESLKFRDLQGNELYRLQEKVIRVRESFSILRGDQVIPNPPPEVVFEAQDCVALIGTLEQRHAFRQLLGAAQPTRSISARNN